MNEVNGTGTGDCKFKSITCFACKGKGHLAFQCQAVKCWQFVSMGIMLWTGTIDTRLKGCEPQRVCE